MVARSPQGLCSKGCIVILVLLAAAGHALAEGGQGGAGGAGGAGGGGGAGGAGGLGGAGGDSAFGVAGLGGNGGAGGASPYGVAGAGGGGGKGGNSPGGIAGGGGSGGKGGDTVTGIVGKGGASGAGGVGNVPGKDGNGGAPGNQPGTPVGSVKAALAEVFIQSVSNDTLTKDCISSTIFTVNGKTNSIGGGNVQVTLLLPGVNPAPLTTLTKDTYDTTSLTLAGIPAQTKTNGLTLNGLPYLIVDFNDVKGVLSSLNGTVVSFQGSYQAPGVGSIKYFFTTPLKVCV